MKKIQAITLTVFVVLLILTTVRTHVVNLQQQEEINELRGNVNFLLEYAQRLDSVDKAVTNVLINERPAFHQDKANKAWGLAWGDK